LKTLTYILGWLSQCPLGFVQVLLCLALLNALESFYITLLTIWDKTRKDFHPCISQAALLFLQHYGFNCCVIDKGFI